MQLRVALLDPFGVETAIGTLDVKDAPGADRRTPSTAELVREMVATDLRVIIPGKGPGAWSLSVMEV